MFSFFSPKVALWRRHRLAHYYGIKPRFRSVKSHSQREELNFKLTTSDVIYENFTTEWIPISWHMWKKTQTFFLEFLSFITTPKDSFECKTWHISQHISTQPVCRGDLGGGTLGGAPCPPPTCVTVHAQCSYGNGLVPSFHPTSGIFN